jgi:hypothetical protein
VSKERLQLPVTQADGEDAPEDRSIGPVMLMALQIAWPSFLMAGVMEGLVFSVVDPTTLHWFGHRAIDWPVQAVYTVSFFLFWLVIAVACAVSRALGTFTDDVRIKP